MPPLPPTFDVSNAMRGRQKAPLDPWSFDEQRTAGHNVFLCEPNPSTGMSLDPSQCASTPPSALRDPFLRAEAFRKRVFSTSTLLRSRKAPILAFALGAPPAGPSGRWGPAGDSDGWDPAQLAPIAGWRPN